MRLTVIHARSRSSNRPCSTKAPDDDEEEDDPPSFFSSVLLPLGLLLLTIFTTLWAGAYQTNTNPLVGAWAFLSNDPTVLLSGIPFAATLLGILITHELGHYVLSRIHRVPTSLPLFIPGPPHLSGPSGPSSACAGLSPIGEPCSISA
ncbi:MAG: hypothetical protein U0361_14970 [Nitrospiraceae bacterium]